MQRVSPPCRAKTAPRSPHSSCSSCTHGCGASCSCGQSAPPVLLGLAIDQTRGWTVPEDPATFTKRMQVSDASGYLARSAIRSDEVFQAVAEAFANDAPLAATLPPMLAVAQNEFLKAKTGRTPTRQAPIADALAARLCHPDFDGRELQILAEASLELLTDKTGPWTRTPPEWAMKAPFPEAPTGPIWSPSLTQCLASLRAALGDRLVVSQGVLDHPPFQAARPVATSESVGMTALRLPARIEMVLPLTVSGEPPALPSLQRTGVLPILLHFRGREVFVISRGEAAEQLVDWARARPAGASREDSEAAK